MLIKNYKYLYFILLIHFVLIDYFKKIEKYNIHLHLTHNRTRLNFAYSSYKNIRYLNIFYEQYISSYGI